MATPVGSLLRNLNRNDGEPLRVLTSPTHERTCSNVCKTGHEFYGVQGPHIKGWDARFAPLPPNYTLLEPIGEDGAIKLPPHLDFDVVLCQNRFGQYPVLKQLADILHLPLITIEHTLPPPGAPQDYLDRHKAQSGNINLFISEYSRGTWGWGEDEADVIHHGVDTDLFCSSVPQAERSVAVLSVVNDWKNRDWCCGYELWAKATAGIVTNPVGDTPGLSKPANGVAELAEIYAAHGIFVNTSLVSPVPTSLLEAMSSGCAVVSTSTCMIPEFIADGENGLLADTPEKIRRCLNRLIHDTNLRQRLGDAARRTIVERFSLPHYVAQWDSIFKTACKIPYVGPWRTKQKLGQP